MEARDPNELRIQKCCRNPRSYALISKHILGEILGLRDRIEDCVDSSILFNFVAKCYNNVEKMLLIDVFQIYRICRKRMYLIQMDSRDF